jgi:carboxyl-terminal processing protease
MLIVAMTTTACVSAEVVKQHWGQMGANEVLKRMLSDMKKSYYDPKLRGIDIDSLYRATQLVVDQARSPQERFRALSAFLLPFDDSHTYYAGGTPIGLSDFGFSFRFYDDRAFVSVVDSYSAADSMGLRRGDEIMSFAGQQLTRDNQYRVLVDFLGRHPITTLDLKVRAPNNSVSDVAITADTAALRKLEGREYRKLYAAAVDSMKRVQGHMTTSIRNKVFVWRLPEFEEADLSLGKVARIARTHEVVVLDLRGNPGGPVDRLEEVIAYFIDRPLEIGTLYMRWDNETYKTKPKGDRLTGKVYLLVDSETGSAAEVFARLLQLEKKATVVGDRTAGAVMASMLFGSASITVSDFVLPDGERLEKKGVQPDIEIVPTAQQIADGDDPVLAHVLALHGVPVTPRQAAKINALR